MMLWTRMRACLAAVLLAFIASGCQGASEDDRIAALLEDLAEVYRAPDAVAEFRTLMQNPAAAPGVLDDWTNDTTPTDEELRQRIFLEVCRSHALVVFVDWADGYEDTLDQLDRQIAGLSGDMPPGQRQEIIDYVERKRPMERGDAVGSLYGPLAAYADSRGLAILDINTGSDMYTFTVVPKVLHERWAGTRLSKDLMVEDPSWQFERQLAGSPYQRFLRK